MSNLDKLSEITELILFLYRKKERCKEHLIKYGDFVSEEYKKKLNHNIIICDMCITRMRGRYNSELNKRKNEL